MHYAAGKMYEKYGWWNYTLEVLKKFEAPPPLFLIYQLRHELQRSDILDAVTLEM